MKKLVLGLLVALTLASCSTFVSENRMQPTQFVASGNYAVLGRVVIIEDAKGRIVMNDNLKQEDKSLNNYPTQKDRFIARARTIYPTTQDIINIEKGSMSKNGLGGGNYTVYEGLAIVYKP